MIPIEVKKHKQSLTKKRRERNIRKPLNSDCKKDKIACSLAQFDLNVLTSKNEIKKETPTTYQLNCQLDYPISTILENPVGSQTEWLTR